MTTTASTTPLKCDEASVSSTVSSIRWLAAPSSRLWVEQAIAKPMQVLIDHAHCERKAAGSAVQLMFRYLCEPGLGEVLSPLAREELEHFEQVLDLIKSRGHIWLLCDLPAMGLFSPSRCDGRSLIGCWILSLWQA